MDQQHLLEQAMIDLGLTREAHASIVRAPSFEMAVERLNAIKAEAKRRYRQLAFELHPDRNGGDEAKTERFKALADVMEKVTSMEVGRPQPPPPVFVRQPFVNVYGPGYTSTGSSSATTAGYCGAFGGVHIYTF